MPYKSVQLVLSVITAKIYGKNERMFPHLEMSSKTATTECSRLYSLLSANSLNNSLMAICPIS